MNMIYVFSYSRVCLIDSRVVVKGIDYVYEHVYNYEHEHLFK